MSIHLNLTVPCLGLLRQGDVDECKIVTQGMIIEIFISYLIVDAAAMLLALG